MIFVQDFLGYSFASKTMGAVAVFFSLQGFSGLFKLWLYTILQLCFCVCIAHLKERLEDYIKQWNGLVKLFRNDKREGLIQARSIGAHKATKGQVS